MHIVIDARIINSTTGRYHERLLTNLQDIDKTNKYTVLVPTKDLSFWKPSNPNFTVVPADFPQYSFAEQLGLNKLLKSLKPDLVHFCMPQQPILYPGKVVTTIHDLTLLEIYMSDKNWLMYKSKQVIGRFVFKQVIRKSKHIITDAQYTKRKLIEFSKFAEGKTTAIHLSADLQQSHASQAFKLPYKKYLLYVGQQSDHKNIVRLAEAHQKLLLDHPDLGLVLAGRKNSATVKNELLFTKRGYSNITFTDFISDAQLNWLYAHAQAYVFPSLMEGFGLPGLEAMGHGTPVISSNASCLPEVYGNAAHYFNPTDTDDMAAAINEVLGNDKLRTRLSTNGYKQIKKFSWKKMAQETHKIYIEALED